MSSALPIFEFIVPDTLAGQRMDRVILQALHSRGIEISRAQIKKHWLKLIVDPEGLTPAQAAQAGLKLRVAEAWPDSASLTNLPLPEIPVIYADEAILVVHKPPGVLVHPTTRSETNTLVHALADQLPSEPPSANLEARFPGVVHRLDRDTEGLLVMGRTWAAVEELMGQFRRREVDKRYAAILRGTPVPPAGRIEAPIARRDHGRDRFHVSSAGRPSETRYRVSKTSARASWVDIKLVTGRTHQIRVHFEHVGHPLLHDPLYHPNQEMAVRALGMPLAALRLGFLHPRTGEALSFELEPPERLQQLWDLVKSDKLKV